LQIWKYYLISLRAGLFSAQNFSFQEVNSMKCHQERRVCAHWTDNWNQEESSTQAREDPSGGLCYHQHTTAQHDIEENYNIFLWELWLKSKLKDSHTHVKENEKRRLLLLAVKWILKKEMTYAYACLDWPSKPLLWKKGYETQRASEPAKPDPRPLPHLKGEWSLTLTKLWKWTMTICEKFCNGKLPDKPNLDKKEAEPS
jgi:hypothetical protein